MIQWNEHENFTQLPRESIDTIFHRFQSIVNKVHANKPVATPAYTDHENSMKLLYALDLKVWEVKVSAIIESARYDTRIVDELYSKLKSTEVDKLSRAKIESPPPAKAFALFGGSSSNPNPAFEWFCLVLPCISDRGADGGAWIRQACFGHHPVLALLQQLQGSRKRREGSLLQLQ